MHTPETSRLAAAFSEHRQPFNQYLNLLAPQLAVVLALYVGYRWANYSFLTIRARWPSQALTVTALLSLVWILLQLVLAAFFVALVANVATYYAHPHYISYGLSFRLLSLFGYHEQPVLKVFTGLDRALGLLLGFGVYVGLREAVLYWVEQPGPRRTYRVVVTNQMTALVTVYVCLGRLLGAFNLVSEESLLVYLFIIPPMAGLYLSTTYWLLPRATPPILRTAPAFLLRLFALSFLWTLPFALLLTRFVFHENFLLVLLGGWIGQVVVTLPMSWFLYQQRQDTILQLRGVEQRLVHSAVELHRLRSQINPHFLFNALNTLYGTALKERAGATAEGVQRLGDMMRFMLEENTQDFIALDREIGYLENYIALQKLRTPPSPTLRIETMIQPPSRPYRIAPMLLLPFVENAFKHGISHKEPSWVRIQLTCEQDSLRFEVRNSRHVRAPNDLEKPGMGIGLQNVTERLRLLYDGRYHLSCQEEGTDFVVHLVLPLSTYE
ncbi:histidine kinase [Hymenobacter sp. BT507]|uniref:Histidine kinase n=1 Tax=Hymenobacter citatus TaxID=2763506 RepID=A0ABR7MQK5_9BACT|nr:histidine kinase [Hymenobacter citatus]